ncbi:hypothetical protein OSB04_012554 [Centaurea solstitialis]|uniref:Reverse transcriptase domain-containing protein n=1 Tax=Centaurea solstitialis TaxID=347529 RepID=A0AA38TBK2_9ASTR|nr:hypothetical protein OSB04_012554 [Centaurea solstitialis]
MELLKKLAKKERTSCIYRWIMLWAYLAVFKTPPLPILWGNVIDLLVGYELLWNVRLLKNFNINNRSVTCGEPESIFFPSKHELGRILHFQFIHGPKPFKLFDTWLEVEGMDRMQRGSRFFGRDIDLFRKEATKLDETADQGSLNEEERERWVNAREKWLEAESKKVEMLRQKAKIKWAMEGDENSRMFHAVIRKRMRANEIGGLNVNGLWVEEPTLVKKAALDFFKIKFFSHGPPGPKLRSSKVKRITREEAETLERLFSKEEVWEAIKDHLEDVGGEVKVGVREHHRGILKGRYILDGVLIANEVVEDLRKTKRKGMVFKVDFEKAYDSVEWDFLLDTLKMMGLGDRWCKWICSCLHSASVLILINGAPTEEFKMKKGHRQGDPLAPFLFLVVAEYLNVLMREATKKVCLKGLR